MADKATPEQIREALLKLDPTNNSQWTNEGLPALDDLKELIGVRVSRAEVTEAAPMFSRDHPTFEEPAAEKIDDSLSEDEELQAVKNQLDEVDAQIESLRKRRLELQADHDRLNTRLQAPKMSFSENVASYLERSHQERIKRSAHAQKVQEMIRSVR